MFQNEIGIAKNATRELLTWQKSSVNSLYYINMLYFLREI